MATTVAGLPVGNVSVSGPDITVSHLLNNPRIIERRIGEAANLEYWIDKILPNIGTNESGVVIYEEWSPTFAALDRSAEEIGDDAEVPLAGSVEGDVKMVSAKTDGLGYVVTDKQKRRNQRFVIDRKERGLANNIAAKLNARGLTAIEAAISAASRTYAASDWSALVTEGANPDAKDLWPHSTIALLQAQARAARIPFNYVGMVADPLDIWRLSVIYQEDGLGNLASKIGLREIISDNTGGVDRGSPILYSDTVGGTAWEEPISVEIVPERRRKRTVVQSTGAAAYFVDNPYGLLELTGVAAADLA